MVRKTASDFDTLLADTSEHLSSARREEIEAEIESALRQTLELFRLDRGTFGEFSADVWLNFICSVAREGFQPLPRGPAPTFLSWYVEELACGRILALESVRDLPPEAGSVANYMRWSGLRSHVGLPLRIGGRVVAAVGFAVFRQSRQWSDELLRQLRLLGSVLALGFARKRAEEQLYKALEEVERLKKAAETPTEEILHITFGLTPAEARIAIGIARGETLVSIAQRHGTTVATVRTQLKSIFLKMGAHRQAEVLTLLTRRSA